MSSTTIRLEGPLLKDLKSITPPGKSLSAWIRSVLEKEIRRYRTTKAAAAYQRFLKSNPDEAAEADAWENAPLGEDPRHRGRR